VEDDLREDINARHELRCTSAFGLNSSIGSIKFLCFEQAEPGLA
jgi:hypothetical protein